jgi:hypothetical protein
LKFHSASYTGAWEFIPGVKLPGREADHSPPTMAEIKKNKELYIASPMFLIR